MVEAEPVEWLLSLAGKTTLPEISFVMSTYARNHGDVLCSNLLKRAIDSVLAQPFPNFEFIIMDDGSQDGTPEVLSEYAKDPRVRIHRKETTEVERKQGTARVYNEAIQLSRGKYISFMFDDDVVEPTFIETLLPVIRMSDKSVGMVHGLVDIINISNPKDFFLGFGKDSSDLQNRNLIAQVSTMIKRKVFEDVGGLDPSSILIRVNDWDLWRRINKKYQIVTVPQKVATTFVGSKDSIGNLFAYDISEAKAYMETDRQIPQINPSSFSSG